MPPGAILLAIAANYSLALLAWLLIRRGRFRLVVTVALLTPLCLLLIAPEHVAARALTAVFCVDASLKVIDYARQMALRNAVGEFRDFLRFLIPFPHLMVVYRPRAAGWVCPSPARELLRLIVGGGVIVLTVFVIKQCQHVTALRQNFLLDHTLKFPMFIAAVEGLSQALCGLERLAGFDTTPIVRWAILSRTPAEFWTRWNQRVHDWLYRNLFVPWGGLRAPVRGVCVVFLVSAAMHELAFGVATSRFDGYQFAFFAVQIPAVLTSRPLLAAAGRWGATGKVVAHGATIGWFYVTSMLFLHGGNRALPWFAYYASEPWLP